MTLLEQAQRMKQIEAKADIVRATTLCDNILQILDSGTPSKASAVAHTQSSVAAARMHLLNALVELGAHLDPPVTGCGCDCTCEHR